jgi:putative hydrolase of the HAD superfamily
MNPQKITTLFLDIGGVLLTNGWGRSARQAAVTQFGLTMEEVDERHHLTFDTYESGKLTLDEYLNRIVFYEPRNFSKEEFTAFMFGQSQALGTNIEFFKQLKEIYGLQVIAVNNVGRELNAYRIEKYRLRTLFDAFVSSSYVHLRKPDVDIFHMACDISQAAPHEVLYIDDRNMFVEVARSIHLNGYHYHGLDAARIYLKSLGLEVP